MLLYTSSWDDEIALAICLYVYIVQDIVLEACCYMAIYQITRGRASNFVHLIKLGSDQCCLSDSAFVTELYSVIAIF